MISLVAKDIALIIKYISSPKEYPSGKCTPFFLRKDELKQIEQMVIFIFLEKKDLIFLGCYSVFLWWGYQKQHL